MRDLQSIWASTEERLPVCSLSCCHRLAKHSDVEHRFKFNEYLEDTYLQLNSLLIDGIIKKFNDWEHPLCSSSEYAATAGDKARVTYFDGAMRNASTTAVSCEKSS